MPYGKPTTYTKTVTKLAGTAHCACVAKKDYNEKFSDENAKTEALKIASKLIPKELYVSETCIYKVKAITRNEKYYYSAYSQGSYGSFGLKDNPRCGPSSAGTAEPVDGKWGRTAKDGPEKTTSTGTCAPQEKPTCIADTSGSLGGGQANIKKKWADGSSFNVDSHNDTVKLDFEYSYEPDGLKNPSQPAGSTPCTPPGPGTWERHTAKAEKSITINTYSRDYETVQKYKCTCSCEIIGEKLIQASDKSVPISREDYGTEEGDYTIQCEYDNYDSNGSFLGHSIENVTFKGCAEKKKIKVCYAPDKYEITENCNGRIQKRIEERQKCEFIYETKIQNYKPGCGNTTCPPSDANRNLTRERSYPGGDPNTTPGVGVRG
jgi:hypothetical protein